MKLNIKNSKEIKNVFIKSKKITQTFSTGKTIIDALREKNLQPKIKVLFNNKKYPDDYLKDILNHYDKVVDFLTQMNPKDLTHAIDCLFLAYKVNVMVFIR